MLKQNNIKTSNKELRNEIFVNVLQGLVSNPNNSSKLHIEIIQEAFEISNKSVEFLGEKSKSKLSNVFKL